MKLRRDGLKFNIMLFMIMKIIHSFCSSFLALMISRFHSSQQNFFLLGKNKDNNDYNIPTPNLTICERVCQIVYLFFCVKNQCASLWLASSEVHNIVCCILFSVLDCFPAASSSSSSFLAVWIIDLDHASKTRGVVNHDRIHVPLERVRFTLMNSFLSSSIVVEIQS